MRLIEDWRRSYRFISMQCMAAAVALQGAWEIMPVQLKERLPDGLVVGISIALLILGMFGRLYIQRGPRDVDAYQDDTGGGAGAGGCDMGGVGAGSIDGPDRSQAGGDGGGPV